MKTPLFIMTIGISGCGKSTWIKEFESKNPNTKIVNPDKIRKILTGDISDQSKNKEVWETAKDITMDFLERKYNVVLDATNVSSNLRKAFIKGLPNCNKYAKVFDTDVEICKKRIKKDMIDEVDRSNVPDEVIERQWLQFEKDKNKIESDGLTII